MELKTISKIYFARLSNAYHVSFLSNVKAGLEKYDALQLGIPVNLYSAFLAALEIEQDIVNRSRASVFTQKLAEFDKTRDNYFKRIYYKLRTAENDSQNAAITPEIIAKINTNFINQYPLSITTEPNQVETAKIRGFIKDLKNYLHDEFVLLGIASDIDILESANDSYEETYMSRIREKTESNDTAECRHTAERCYLQITYQLAATANAESEDIDEMMKIEMCRNVIDELNLLVKDFKAKAYKKTNLDDEEIEEENEDEDENLRHEDENV